MLGINNQAFIGQFQLYKYILKRGTIKDIFKHYILSTKEKLNISSIKVKFVSRYERVNFLV